MTARAKLVRHDDGRTYGIRFECPGCATPHVVPALPEPSGWTWNGSIDAPTLSPSILVHPHGVLLENGSVGQTPRCHSFVSEGRIQFLADCTHALAGHTVDLPEIG